MKSKRHKRLEKIESAKYVIESCLLRLRKNRYDYDREDGFKRLYYLAALAKKAP